HRPGQQGRRQRQGGDLPRRSGGAADQRRPRPRLCPAGRAGPPLLGRQAADRRGQRPGRGGAGRPGGALCRPGGLPHREPGRKLAPLFDPDTQLTILPDGVTVEQDGLTLNGTALRRLGDSLVVLGDLRLTEDCAEALSNLEYLQVEGDIYLPESLADALDAVTETFFAGEVRYRAGKPL